MSDATSMERGWPFLQVGCVALVLVTVGILIAWIWREFQRGWTKEKLESLIAAEVPAGCNRAHVDAWFDKHRIQHQYMADTTGDQSGNSTMPMLAGLRDQALRGMERGLIEGPEANVGFLESGRISVYFFFDKEGRVVGHLVHTFIYSP